MHEHLFLMPLWLFLQIHNCVPVSSGPRSSSRSELSEFPPASQHPAPGGAQHCFQPEVLGPNFLAVTSVILCVKVREWHIHIQLSAHARPWLKTEDGGGGVAAVLMAGMPCGQSQGDGGGSAEPKHPPGHGASVHADQK